MDRLVSVLATTNSALFRTSRAADDVWTRVDRGPRQPVRSSRPEDAEVMHRAELALHMAKESNSPQARAEEKLADAERKIRMLRAAARLAAASGDAQALARISREAATLARQVGAAAATFGQAGAGASAPLEDSRQSSGEAAAAQAEVAGLHARLDRASRREDTAVEERAVEERAVEERAVEERAVEERAVEEREGRGEGDVAYAASSGKTAPATPDDRENSADDAPSSGLCGESGRSGGKRGSGGDFARRAGQALSDLHHVLDEVERARERDPDERERVDRRGILHASRADLDQARRSLVLLGAGALRAINLKA